VIGTLDPTTPSLHTDLRLHDRMITSPRQGDRVAGDNTDLWR
jgi:hypothetical protein